jgi:hypothetical protein
VGIELVRAESIVQLRHHVGEGEPLRARLPLVG